MHTMESTPKDQFRGTSVLGKVLVTDTTRMAVSEDHVIQNPSEWNTDMFLAILCALHWRILVIPLMIN